jgi:3D (Asp-Asp-Asp) domain-containing protein
VALPPPASRTVASPKRQVTPIVGPVRVMRTVPVPVKTAVGRSLGVFVITCYDLAGRTASGSGTSLATVAVDPTVIPLGTRIYIQGVGVRVAQDTGGAIRGHRLDLWEPSYSACTAWGVQSRSVSMAG